MQNDSEKISEICDRFESHWAEEIRVRAEEYLDQVTEEFRPQLLEQLVQIELWWRRHDAVKPSLQEFTKRFQNYTQSIQNAFDEYQRQNAEAIIRRNQGEELDPVYGMLIDSLDKSDTEGALGLVGELEIQELIGKGNFGYVFRAVDLKLQRTVAVKVLSPIFSSHSPARKRFIREARASAAIDNEHVTTVHSVESNPFPYIVMEYVSGETLETRLRSKGPVDVSNALEIAIQIADGLRGAHLHGIVHRDIKPSNVILCRVKRGLVKITDFGLARTVDDASLSQSGVIAGTPLYMSPEQTKGELVDERSDLFSLGSVIYEMLCGHSPFRARGIESVISRIQSDAPRPMKECSPEIPTCVSAVVTRLLAKSVKARYQSANEVYEALRKCKVELSSGNIASNRSANTFRVSSRKRLLIAAAIFFLFAIAIWGGTILSRQRALVTTPSSVTDSSPFNGKMPAQVAPWQPAKGSPPPALAPFNQKEAATSQEDWAEYLGISVESSNSIGMKFRVIPPGAFAMGTNEMEGEHPSHPVKLTKPFLISMYEVTQDEYTKVTGLNPSRFVGPRHPVNQVSWGDAVKFCELLSGLPEERAANRTYRLPTEAEWEFSCRAGTITAYGFGDARRELDRYCWYKLNSNNSTHPVGQKLPNHFGLYDLHGNVFEWCSDRFGNYSSETETDPEGHDSNTVRVYRGGNWSIDANNCRSASRHSESERFIADGVGFRVVVSLEIPTSESAAEE